MQKDDLTLVTVYEHNLQTYVYGGNFKENYLHKLTKNEAILIYMYMYVLQSADNDGMHDQISKLATVLIFENHTII